ncbi:MAG: beta-ketoacyl synthase chain length factor [Duodenibacillus sp.]
MTAFLLACTALSLRTDVCADQALWQRWALEKDAPLPVSDAPAVCPVPALLRRRMTPFGRVALSAMADLAPRDSETLLFASNWGDVTRGFALHSSLAANAEVSPAAFSSSVHNGSIAIASIWQKNHTAYRALSAGPCTAAAGLMEGFLTLKASDDCRSVILVRAEDAVPALWHRPGLCDAPGPMAWAMRLTLPEYCRQALFTIRVAPLANSIARNTPDCATPIDEMRWLAGGPTDLTVHDGQRGWHCVRLAA